MTVKSVIQTSVAWNIFFYKLLLFKYYNNIIFIQQVSRKNIHRARDTLSNTNKYKRKRRHTTSRNAARLGNLYKMGHYRSSWASAYTPLLTHLLSFFILLFKTSHIIISIHPAVSLSLTFSPSIYRMVVSCHLVYVCGAGRDVKRKRESRPRLTSWLNLHSAVKITACSRGISP